MNRAIKGQIIEMDCVYPQNLVLKLSSEKKRNDKFIYLFPQFSKSYSVGLNKRNLVFLIFPKLLKKKVIVIQSKMYQEILNRPRRRKDIRKLKQILFQVEETKSERFWIKHGLVSYLQNYLGR